MRTMYMSVRGREKKYYIIRGITMELSEAIIHALNGDAVLFVGSGFSVGATKSSGEQFLTAKPLAHKLLSMCGYRDDELVDDLGQAAQIYVANHTESSLLDYLRNEFSAVDTTAAQKVIASLPWMRVYTTNYDNVVELAALQEVKRHITPVTLSRRMKDYRDKSHLCVHLNGSVENLSSDKLTGEFKLTNVSYLTNEFLLSEWVKLFKGDLATARAVFFVGYSMKYDLDIQRIVYAQPELVSKTFFICRADEPRANVELVKLYGTPCPINTDGFADIITNEKKSYVPVTTLSRPVLCFRKPNVGKTPPTVLDTDEFNFLVKGDYDEEKLYYSEILPDEVSYSIHRTRLNETLDAIISGEKNILVHSDLGNGKTIFVETLSTILQQQGYDVYIYSKFRATLPSEIERICSKDGKTVIVVEDYASHLDILKEIQLHRAEQILILSERSAMNDVVYNNLSELLGDFQLIDVNKLDVDEITRLVELLDHYGFWSYLSSDAKYRKEDFIRTDCKAQLRDVILKILKSETILNRFNDILNAIKQKSDYYDAILFMLIAQVSKLNVDLDDLADGLNIQKLNNPSFLRNQIVREFVDIDGVTLKMKSSLVSEVLLQKICDSTVVIDVMLKVVRQLNNYRGERGPREILRKLITFANIQYVLNKDDAGYKYNLLRYYEEIKTVDFCKNNPHFWLQYAIVKLSEFDYGQAKIYFDTAYAHARRTNYDTFQIDNHYARFLLENEIKYGTRSTCMVAFNQAHNILMDKKHLADVRYYPYRVAKLYLPFYEKYYTEMTEDEQKSFRNSCADMLRRLEWYVRTSIGGGLRRDVQQAKTNLEQILLEVSIDE